MDAAQNFVAAFFLAFMRFLPAVVLAGMTPLRWTPPLLRIVMAMVLAWMTIQALPWAQMPVPSDAVAWMVAASAELTIGVAFGLALMLPQAAMHMAGWVVDVQAGMSAAVLFNPGAQGDMQSLLGTALVLLGTVLFFVLDLHLDLYRAIAASARTIPLGQVGVRLDLKGFLGLLASSFLLGIMLVAPVIVGLLAVDAGVAYATRSMPQANVYFLALPLKAIVSILLMVATLPFVPALFERLYRDAFARVPQMLGG
jgi:flagellar biosynthetic protein FliR